MENTEELVFNLFEYFTRKIFNYDEKWYKIFPKRDSLLVENMQFEKGFNSLWLLFLFQFNNWSKKIKHESFSGHKGKIELSFIIGKKAINEYNKRDKNFDSLIFYTKFQKEFNIDKDSFIKKYYSVAEIKTYIIENEYKRKFHNTEKGIVICNTYTRGFSQKNIYCLICNNKEICKNIV